MTVETLEPRIHATLASTFGFSSFRPLQEDIVRQILAGQDVFVLMPTGGGKSLCYQLPALLSDGLTIVVSPLIALMKDQVDALEALGVPATYINSSLDSSEISRRQTMVERGAVKLLYVAPERLMMPGFLGLLRETRIAFFAIDEAHCISEWGHDFRPEYRQLKQIREFFPDVPVGAFTATATKRVQADILAQLGMERAATFQGSFNRANLFYDVRPKKGAYTELLAYLRAHPDASGIIYCGSRAGTERLAGDLGADGFQAAAYHAGLTPEQRRQRHESFMRDDIRIITATIAFGMGIDKPDVRFVVHYDLPRTLENYYQESGRAGRDGEPSDAILFFSGGDVIKLRGFAEQKETESERRTARWQVQQMADWADSPTCRRQALLAYFDESFDPQPAQPVPGSEGRCCDVCLTPSTREDVTIPAQMLLSCIKRTRERFGASHVIDVLRGSRVQRVLQLGHDRLSTYGIGKDRSADDWRQLTRQLVQAGYIHQDPDDFNVLRVTERGHAVLFQNEPVVLSVRHRPEALEDAIVQPHRDLFERLRVLRKRLADEREIPPYVIFHDTTLRHLAAELPSSREQFLRIQGVGERKAADYGDIFLVEIAGYMRETGATPESLPEPAPAPRTPRGLGDSARSSLRFFQNGQSIEAIMDTRHLAYSTIMEHLTEAMEHGERLDIDRLIDPDKHRTIRAAMEIVSAERLKPILEHLGEDYTYEELRLVRAAVRASLLPGTGASATEHVPQP